MTKVPTIPDVKVYIPKASSTCFELGDKIDGSEPYRSMDVQHEKDTTDTMPIYAHERCIDGSPNENNWKYAVRHEASL